MKNSKVISKSEMQKAIRNLLIIIFASAVVITVCLSYFFRFSTY